MILIDEILSYDGDSLLAAVTITDASLFVTAEGVPGYVGIEYMAQACGAYAGAQSLDSGEPVRIGLLLGSRNYRVTVPRFSRGERLLISARMIFRDDPLAAFACSITLGTQVVAEAELNVYYGDDDHLRVLQGSAQ